MEARPRITELQGDGLTWIHLLGPTTEEAQLLASRFGWHPLDVEDVLSRRQRPKVDVYADDPEGGYLFAVLHFPVYDKTVGRLNAGELDVFLGPDYLVTLPATELRPVSLLFRRAEESDEFRDQLLSRGRREEVDPGDAAGAELSRPGPRLDDRGARSRPARTDARQAGHLY